MAILAENTIERFISITNFDIVGFLQDYSDFMDQDRSNIIDYYSGTVSLPNVDSFNNLSILLEESNHVLNLFSVNKESFGNYADWNLLDQLEQINITLLTVSNSSKFLRSAITKNNFSPNPEVDLVLKQNQTLEGVEKDMLRSLDPNNDWVNLAIRNDLNEEKYTPAGNVPFKASFKNGSSFFLNSVVDNIQGIKVYGLDVQAKISFVDNDLLVLGYTDTIVQSAQILSGLRQGSNPSYPNDGLQSSLVVGSNLGAIAYPTIFRQMYNTFATDDSFKSFTIDEIKQNQDALSIKYKVETRLQEVLSLQTSI